MGHSQTKNKGFLLAVLRHMLEIRSVKTSEKSSAAFYDFVLRVSKWLERK